jgi:hypothetical protein
MALIPVLHTLAVAKLDVDVHVESGDFQRWL